MDQHHDDLRPRPPQPCRGCRGAGLVISAGKMSNLWSGQPVTIRLDDLEVICEVLGCEPGDLLVREPGKVQRPEAEAREARAAVGGGLVIRRQDAGRSGPPV